jgi:hypothetical protein
MPLSLNISTGEIETTSIQPSIIDIRREDRKSSSRLAFISPALNHGKATGRHQISSK